MKLLASLSLLVLAVASAYAAPAEWSPTVEGLRGRLVLDALPGAMPQLAISIEIDNVSDLGNPMVISWGGTPSHTVKLVLEDEAGKPIAEAGIGGNELSPPPFILMLPHASTLRMTISKSAYEYGWSGHTQLRPYSLHAWDMSNRTGKLFLRATVTPVPTTEKLDHPWKGPLELPRVQLP